MKNHRWSRRIQVSFAAMVMVVTSCTDAPVVPQARDAGPALPRNLWSTTDGSRVSLTDEYDGETYTLNTDTREITRQSDGAILELDLEQAAVAATAFYGNVVADAVLNGFGDACPPEHPCAEPMSSTPGAVGIGDDSPLGFSGLILQKESEGTRTHRSGRFGASLVGSLPANPYKSLRNSATIMSGDICSDIINSVLQSRLDYSTNRTSFIKEGFLTGVTVGGGILLRMTLPAGTISAARFIGNAVAAQEGRIAISVLGWMWNSYFCGSGPVTAGPVIRGFGGEAGTTMSLTCHWESWLISFDGGKKFERINVDVCEFQQT